MAEQAWLQPFVPVISSLLGVGVGFWLKERSDRRKDEESAKKAVDALHEEVRAILAMAPQKRETLSSGLKHLKDGQILPLDSVPFPRQVYDTKLVTLLSRLNMKERNLLHVAYNRLQTIDRYMDGYKDTMVDALTVKDMKPGGAMKMHVAGLTDLLKNLEVTTHLLRTFLDGTPEDVFFLDMADEDRQKLNFDRPTPRSMESVLSKSPPQ